MISQKYAVLFDAHSLEKGAGGIETYNRNIIRQLNNKGIELILYLSKIKKTKKTRGQAYYPFSDHGLFRIFWGFRTALAKYSPKIIHTNNFLPFPSPNGVKKVITIHDTCFLKEKNWLLKQMFKELLIYSIKHADQIIANSEFTKTEIIKLSNSKKTRSKITVIYHGVDPVFKPIGKRAAKKTVQKKFKVKYDYFVFSGNITKRKNLQILELIASRLNVFVVVTGKMPGTMSIQSNKVRVLGHVPTKDLNYIYNASEGLIYPSSCEGFGLSILEAMRCKIPIIASDIKVFREIFKNSIVFVKKQSDWINTAQMILTRKYSAKLIKKAFLLSKSYTWEKTAKKTIEVYSFA